jgi:hypothetical protein
MSRPHHGMSRDEVVYKAENIIDELVINPKI